MRSNCVLFAYALWWRRGLWRDGISWRKSNYGNFPHCMYAQKRASGQYRMVHYVPLNPVHKTVPPLLFQGRVKWGDL